MTDLLRNFHARHDGFRIAAQFIRRVFALLVVAMAAVLIVWIVLRLT